MFRSVLAAFALLSMPLSAASAQTYDAYGKGRISAIEASYMPGMINFQLDTSIGGCAAGQFIVWRPQGSTQTARDQNAQAVFATLLTAKASNQSILVYLTSNGCTATFLYLA